MFRNALLSCLLITALFGSAQADEQVFSGTIYDLYVTTPVEVGDGSEELVGVELYAVNKTGNAAYNASDFDGVGSGYTGFTGTMHQHYSDILGMLTPTLTYPQYATVIDTHFAFTESDMQVVTTPSEDVSGAGPSAEATDALPPFDNFGFTDFGNHLTGTFSVDAEASLTLAHLVLRDPGPTVNHVPFGHGEINAEFYLGGAAGGETLRFGIGYFYDSGDLNSDGYCNWEDVNIAQGNIGQQPGPTAPDYDFDGDCDVDDFTYLIEHYLEWSRPGASGVGSKRGDLNFNGVIDATDLARMQSYFGQTTHWYGRGNVNEDDVINATDLAILAENYGFAAPGGSAVPEPATLGLLSLGGLALLKRRT